MKFLICSLAIFVVLVSAEDPTEDCSKLATHDKCCAVDTCRWSLCGNDNATCISLNVYNETLCNTTCLEAVQPNSTVAPTPTANNGTNDTSISPNTTEPPTTDSPGNGTTAVPGHKTTVKPAPPCHAAFNAASFIGGIVLCAGVVAIVLFACKFYQSRQEQNYHTL